MTFRHRFAAFLSIILFIMVPAFHSLYCSDLAGEWSGSISVPGMELLVVVRFEEAAEQITGTIDIPAQHLKDLPLADIAVDNRAVAFRISGIPGDPVFRGELSADGRTLRGDFTQGGQTFPFAFTKKDEGEAELEAYNLSLILDKISDYLDTTMAYWKVPGLAMAIVKDGEVIFAEGFGHRDIERQLPVTPATLFAIGSSTKAFTATGLGILAGEGKIDLDKPVREYLPGFRLSDPIAAERMTPRDLLTHRSGLPRHDLMWYGSTATRQEMFERLRYLKSSKDFRTAYQYQNLMYMTAGYLAGAVTGMSWEEFTKQRILEPLGMTSTNFSVDDSQRSEDHALPYRKNDDGTVARIPFKNISEIGPAGSINSNIMDLVRWIKLNLGNGEVDGQRIVPETILKDIHTPHMVLPQGRYSESLNQTYGLGWFIEVYRGRKLIHHGGNIDGFSALVVLFPGENIGIVTLTNLNGNFMPFLSTRYAADLLLGLEPIDWHARLDTLTPEEAEREKQEKLTEQNRIKGTKPTHDLSQLAGEFEHPGYGTIRITEAGKKLRSSFNGLEFEMEHWHYNVFSAAAVDVPRLKFLVNFHVNSKGDPDRLTIPLEAAADEIEFTRIPPREMFDPDYLAVYTGDYELSTQNVKVELRGDNSLSLTVSGQPSYTLEPYKIHEFTLKGLSGYSVKFTVENNKGVTEAVFFQPNGIFVAKRKE